MRCIKIYTAILICFILSSVLSNAQTDFKDTTLDKIPDIEKAKVFNELAERSAYRSDVNKAIEYAFKALEYAQRFENVEQEAIAYNFLGISHYNKDDFENALQYYQKSLKATMKVGEKEEVANLMRKIGIVYVNLKRYKKALIYFEQTLNIYKGLGYSNRVAEAYSNIGLIYYSWKIYEDALENYKSALTIYEELQKLLIRNARNDERFGTTTTGPHRDDLIFNLDNRPLKSFGSQGQQKSFILALKMAETDNLEKIFNEPPLLLLDDMSFMVIVIQ